MSLPTAPAPLVALVWSAQQERAALLGGDVSWSGPASEALARVAELEVRAHPRWVWWDASHDARPVVRAGLVLQRCWDLAEAHRLLAGGWQADPGSVWARAVGLPRDQVPRTGGDLFDFAGEPEPGLPAEPTTALPDGVGALLTSGGYLQPVAADRTALRSDTALTAWASAALCAAERQAAQLEQVSPRAVGTAGSESAAALLCVELEEAGLPLDLVAAERRVADAAGPRPTSPEHARAIAKERDAAVLRHASPSAQAAAHAPTAGSGSGVDLRNPAQVRALLAAAGIEVRDTRAWRLEAFRETSPLVAALLDWRKAERIATTYGYAWLDASVGTDRRLRGRWSASDGAAGRMTASNGLHNLPRPLRPAVAAEAGHVLVRADLGQIEPRVLAAVSGDAAFARDTQAPDLYAPVAARLGVERARAKIAVLAAMYGQTSGAAGEALAGLQRAYPTAIAYLEAAYDEGVAGRAVRTWGGRRVPMGSDPVTDPRTVVVTDPASGPRTDPSAAQGALAGRGRFARNAVVQGAAAELFKAWAATLRPALPALGAQIVLCLHDELLVHAPEAAADRVVMELERALTDAARRWTGGTQVRFVAETRVVRRWSEAKD